MLNLVELKRRLENIVQIGQVSATKNQEGKALARVVVHDVGEDKRVTDFLPVIGFADDVPNHFFFVGQGGFGIQTAPAAAALAGAVLLDRPLPAFVAHIDPAPFGPARIAR